MSPTPTPTPFGAPMRKHFLIDPAYKNLNHGMPLILSSPPLTSPT